MHIYLSIDTQTESYSLGVLPLGLTFDLLGNS